MKNNAMLQASPCTLCLQLLLIENVKKGNLPLQLNYNTKLLAIHFDMKFIYQAHFFS